jgi:hypothetical protein
VDIKRALGIKPNGITATAVRHPVAYSAFTALLVLGIAQINMRGDFLVGSVLLGLAMGLLDWFLWRPNGPGTRWASRASAEGAPQR